MSWLRGWLLNSSCVVVMIVSQFVSYDIFKRMLFEWMLLGDILIIYFFVLFLVGLVVVMVMSLIDVIKMWVMFFVNKQGIMGMIGDIYCVEGIMWMFKGWLLSFFRLGLLVYIC